jgi:hypothetical protein
MLCVSIQKILVPALSCMFLALVNVLMIFVVFHMTPSSPKCLYYGTFSNNSVTFLTVKLLEYIPYTLQSSDQVGYTGMS